MPRAKTTADVFNAIAEPIRRQIVELLARSGTLAVGTLVAALGLPQPAVSKHLGVLRKVGVVAVMSGKSRPWSPEGELALLAFTDLAALLIASMMMGEKQSALAGQLQGALDSRAVIEQAKGVLIGAKGMSARQAYTELRAQARSERRKLAAVCAEIVAGASGDSHGDAQR